MSTAIAPVSVTDFVEMTKSASGRLYKKHILNYGPLRHPVTGATIHVDQEFVDQLQSNFESNVCGIVQVPLAGARNEHTEDPDRNIGEVVGLQSDGSKVYAVIDVRDSDRAEKIGKTLLGASAMMNLNYTNAATGEKVGPTLLHVAVTNRPYVTNLDDFEEIVAATADNSSTDVVLLTATQTKEEDPAMELSDLLAALKNDHHIDVVALSNRIEELQDQNSTLALSGSTDEVEKLQERVAELESQLAETQPAVELCAALSASMATSGVIELSAGEVTAPTDKILEAVVGISQANVELSRQIAETEIDGYVEEGRILPAQREAMLQLSQENRELFDKVLPEAPLVSLSQESGSSHAQTAQSSDDYAKRLVEMFDPAKS